MNPPSELPVDAITLWKLRAAIVGVWIFCVAEVASNWMDGGWGERAWLVATLGLAMWFARMLVMRGPIAHLFFGWVFFVVGLGMMGWALAPRLDWKVVRDGPFSPAISAALAPITLVTAYLLIFDRDVRAYRRRARHFSADKMRLED